MTPLQQHKTILLFLERLRNSAPKITEIFKEGSCFNLYLILSTHYPQSTPYYNSDHIITKINNHYYDIEGEVKNTKHYLPLSKYHSKKTLSKAVKQLSKFQQK